MSIASRETMTTPSFNNLLRVGTIALAVFTGACYKCTPRKPEPQPPEKRTEVGANQTNKTDAQLFRSVKMGMTRIEVEKLLGTPLSKPYDDEDAYSYCPFRREEGYRPGPDGKIMITYSKNVVTAKVIATQNEEGFGLIKVGMTRAEVEELVGRGMEGDNETLYGSYGPLGPNESPLRWCSMIIVYTNNRVKSKTFVGKQ
jgi:outer membrane protein assembly factor BamE (lipoprotein component of BamABCDE complex)